MEKMSVWISPKLIENSSISMNNNIWFVFNNSEEVFLMSLANIIELKSNNKDKVSELLLELIVEYDLSLDFYIAFLDEKDESRYKKLFSFK